MTREEKFKLKKLSIVLNRKTVSNYFRNKAIAKKENLNPIEITNPVANIIKKLRIVLDPRIAESFLKKQQTSNKRFFLGSLGIKLH